jgi:hypothetical protein
MTLKKVMLFTVSVICFLLALSSASEAEVESKDEVKQEPILVGRVTHAEGRLLRYIPEKEIWAATAADTPFALNDRLYSEVKAKAELMLPNNTMTRIGSSTEIQLVELKTDATEMVVDTGIARFYNKGSGVQLKVITPRGYVIAPGGTSFDVWVKDGSVEVVASQGKVEFIHADFESRLEVVAGSSSLVAEERLVRVGTGQMQTAWYKWNAARDKLWGQRVMVKGESATYLPPELSSDAYVFEKHGRWERVYYDGSYRYFWRPVGVYAGWQPFMVGRWIEWNADLCWVPAEPFGYVTHHYGTWVTVGSAWYWAPPVFAASVQVGVPFVNMSLNWYPGRVAWLRGYGSIGWVPLAPGEVYYTHRYWGPDALVVGSVGIAGVSVGVSSYRYIRSAVVVRESHFFQVNNYQRVVVRRTNIVNVASGFHASPVVNDSVMTGYSANARRYGQTVIDSNRLHRSANKERIARNQSLAAGDARHSARGILAGAHGISRSDPSGRAGLRKTMFSEVRGHGSRSDTAGLKGSGKGHGGTGKHYRTGENYRGPSTAHGGGAGHLKAHGNSRGYAQGHGGGMRQSRGHEGFIKFAARGTAGPSHGSDRQKRTEQGGHGKGGHALLVRIGHMAGSSTGKRH